MGALDSFLSDVSPTYAGDPAMQAVFELEAAARMLDIEDWIRERLRHPESEATFNFSITRDSGEPLTCPLMHVAHSTTRGIPGGTLAFAPDAFPEHLRACAMHETWRNGLLALPCGGAAAALRCDPRSLSERELRRLAANVAEASFARPCILGPGAGANAAMMGWLSAAHHSPLAFTGKPDALGGFSHDEVAATAVAYLIRLILDRRGRRLDGARIAVQGIERLGMPLLAFCHDLGAHIVGVADVSGALLDKLGLNPASLGEHVNREGVLLGYPDAEAARNDDLLECECDVLVLAAAESQVSPANCGRVKAPIVVETTPGAVCSSALPLIRERGVLVVPELLAGGGYAIGSFIEANRSGAITPRKPRRNALVRHAIRNAELRVHEFAEKWDVGYPDAALAIGVESVAAAVRASGR